jgi:uncharacterized integral membrane protein
MDPETAKWLWPLIVLLLFAISGFILADEYMRVMDLKTRTGSTR